MWCNEEGTIQEVPNGYTDFVYKIEIAGKFYIGKKSFYSIVRRNFGKKESALVTDKRKKKYEHITKESNWLKYCSSSDEVKNLIEDGNIPVRIILKLCKTRKEATWYEESLLFKHIADELCLNENIGGRYFKKEIKEWLND